MLNGCIAQGKKGHYQKPWRDLAKKKLERLRKKNWRENLPEIELELSHVQLQEAL